MGKNLVINGVVFNGVDSIDMIADDGSAVRYVEEGAVTPDVPDVPGVTVAKIGTVEYDSVAKALAAAVSGDTVKMVANSAETMISVCRGVTLDLAGYTLEADYVNGFSGSNVIDSSASKSGLLKVEKDAVSLSANNSQMPVWNGTNGYVILTMKNQYTGLSVTADAISFSFRPGFGSGKGTYFANGSDKANVKFMVRATWDRDARGSTTVQSAVYGDAMVAEVYSANKTFSYSVTGLSAYQNVISEIVVVSNTGVEVAYKMN